MAFRPDLVRAHAFPEARQSYTKRDAILYALGVGLGADPADLPFLLERDHAPSGADGSGLLCSARNDGASDALSVLPTFAVTLGSPGMWIRAPDYRVNFAKLVHYEQAATFHAPLPPEGEIVARARVASVTDRGEGRGAVVVVERAISDAPGAPLCTLAQTLLLRGDGGFGGETAPQQASVVPDRAPDATVAFSVDPRAALIYRLSGDWNPLHADPEAARRAGFERPILHGLASYAIAGVVIARALGLSPAALGQLACRFAGIVYPGDRLDFRIWRESRGAAFQAFVGERKALDQGFATFGGGA
jgi:acyl dehydratase